MSTAENIYSALLKLYPRKHRQEYGRLMLQHARDQERAARQLGRRHTAVLYLRLIGDGLVNAAGEHLDAVRTADNIFNPVPWPAVLLAAIPGLWLALTRRHADLLAPALSILGIGYILLLLVAAPITWRRTRRFPVWALLPAGMLAWLLIYKLGTAVSSQVGPSGSGSTQWAVILLLNSALVVVIFIIMLHGLRVPTAAWVFIVLMLLSGLPLLVQLNQSASWNGRGLPEYLMAALSGPVEALMLVAVGLLAARRHNVLALLVIVGGYGYIFGDSDYLWGSPSRSWPGIPLYLAGMTFLFFVLAPVGLLRAKTGLGRAVALFIPAALFLVARLAIPFLVLGPAATVRAGDVLISANILLSLIVGWLLYSCIGETAGEASPTGLPVP